MLPASGHHSASALFDQRFRLTENEPWITDVAAQEQEDFVGDGHGAKSIGAFYPASFPLV